VREGEEIERERREKRERERERPSAVILPQNNVPLLPKKKLLA